MESSHRSSLSASLLSFQDFVVYLMSGTSTIFGRCREHCHGEDEDRLKVDILLYAPDVLPQHCCIRRLDHVQPPSGDHRRTATMLKPLHGAPVTRNGLRLQEEVELSPGDLVGLGQHYLFLFKDPTSSSGRLQAPPWTTTLCPDSRPCSACGSALTEKTWRRRALLPRWRDASGAEALLSYELEQEEQVLQEILQTLDPSGDEAKLTPAFLLILCIQHSAATFPLTQFRQLLLRIASQIQRITWVRWTAPPPASPWSSWNNLCSPSFRRRHRNWQQSSQSCKTLDVPEKQAGTRREGPQALFLCWFSQGFRGRAARTRPGAERGAAGPGSEASAHVDGQRHRAAALRPAPRPSAAAGAAGPRWAEAPRSRPTCSGPFKPQ